jgi:hypothetical protein
MYYGDNIIRSTAPKPSTRHCQQTIMNKFIVMTDKFHNEIIQNTIYYILKIATFMQSSSWGAVNYSTGQQELSCYLQNTKFNYLFHKSPPLGLILRQIMSIHPLTPCFSKDIANSHGQRNTFRFCVTMVL